MHKQLTAADDDDDEPRWHVCVRAAKQHGLLLQRSRRRNPEVPAFGTYQPIGPCRNWLGFADPNSCLGCTLSETEAYLSNLD